ncbi:MAG: hypothetical protein JRJ00_09170 [Deltaproteobacteria bacterium]|nr:hypothetical protein [Deltaproteobacteria bacterium]
MEFSSGPHHNQGLRQVLGDWPIFQNGYYGGGLGRVQMGADPYDLLDLVAYLGIDIS